MLTGFPRIRWPRRRFSKSFAVRISVKISRTWEFRVIMGMMTGVLGCCSSSTLESCIIRPAPSGGGGTTPSQPGHYPLIKLQLSAHAHWKHFWSEYPCFSQSPISCMQTNYRYDVMIDLIADYKLLHLHFQWNNIIQISQIEFILVK